LLAIGRVTRTILHVGADKCGSSSIQGFLSHQPVLLSSDHRVTFEYACIRHSGLLAADDIRTRAKQTVSGYFNSHPTSRILDLGEFDVLSIQQRIADHPADLIFSCEGWLRSLLRTEHSQALFNLLSPPGSGRDLEFIAFVRPPVKWINSAWWQWGVWGCQDGFDAWLQHAIKLSSWHTYLEPLAQNPRVDRLIVEPVLADVVSQFCDILGVATVADMPARSNISLPAEALQLYLHHRHHRPDAHASANDFLIMQAIGRHQREYTRTPWVLGMDQVQQIIEATHASNLKLLEYVSDSSRQQILDDSSWWEPRCYEHRQPSDPFEIPTLSQEQLLLLSSDLLDSLANAVQLLRRHQLDLDQLFVSNT
jgi:hypothetical protein